MNNKSTRPVKPRNPATALKHRQEVLWQITVPLIVGIVIVLALAAMTAFGATAAAQSQMADVALVELITPVLIFGMITLLVLGASIYGMLRLLGVLPYFFMRAQIIFLRIQLGVMRVDKRLVAPVIKTQTFAAQSRAFRRSLWQVFGFK